MTCVLGIPFSPNYNMSTNHVNHTLHQLVAEIEAAHEYKEIALTAFLDIEAFDHTFFYAVISALAIRRINGTDIIGVKICLATKKRCHLWGTHEDNESQRMATRRNLVIDKLLNVLHKKASIPKDMPRIFTFA